MTPCARGCCWTAFQVCAKARECDCHPKPLPEWLGTKTDEPPLRLGHKDPTANQAIGNVMSGQQRKEK